MVEHGESDLLGVAIHAVFHGQLYVLWAFEVLPSEVNLDDGIFTSRMVML